VSHDAVDPGQDTSGRLSFLGGPLPAVLAAVTRSAAADGSIQT